MAEVVLSHSRRSKSTPSRAGTIFSFSASRRTVLTAVLVASTYYLTAKIGFAFALQPGSISTLWMPNSILLAGLLITPQRNWWLIIAAVFPAHLASELHSGVPFPMVLSWFVSNSVQAYLGAFCLTRVVGSELQLDSFGHFAAFLFFGVFLAPFVSSFLDIALVKLNGLGDRSYADLWRIRFLANVVATLTVVPVVLSWTKGSIGLIRHTSRWSYLEAALLMIGLFVVSKIVFGAQFSLTAGSPSLLYWPLPFLLWAAVRFGVRGTSIAILALMFLAIRGAASGDGPFVGRSTEENALAIQWFLIVVSIPMIALAAVIQERERAKGIARQNEEQLAMALDAAQMGTWDWNFVDNTARWSEHTKTMFGLLTEDKELPAEAFFKIIHPDDRKHVDEAIGRAIREGTPYEAEFRVMQSDGSTRWVRGKGKVIGDGDGRRPSRMVGLNADITERKQAEQALRESLTRLARTEEISTVMATHVALDGTWLKVPPTLCQLVGYTAKELLARRFQDITHPDDIEGYWEQCQRLIRKEIKSFDYQKRCIHKDGHHVWISLNCSAVEDEKGQVVHFLTYIKDITEQKRSEQALRESNERNQAILRALPDMMFLHTKEGVYLDYYARDPKGLLLPAEQFIGKNLRDVLPSDLSNRIMDCVQEITGTDETRVIEYSLNIGNTERFFEARLVGAEGDNILSIVRDITERRLAADALRVGEEKLLHSNRQIRTLAARLLTAQESERRRISLLLHDDLSQNIATLSIAISRLKRKLPESSEQLIVELDRLGKHTNDLTTQMRRLSHQLHPEVLEHLGLARALESQVTEFGQQQHIKTEFTADIGSEPIPQDVSVCLYRVALEALRNVSRHADASSVSVSLIKEDHSLTLEVSDSGLGFDMEKARTGSGIGLLSAEERVKLLHGRFEIRTKAGVGTTLLARIPLVKTS